MPHQFDRVARIDVVAGIRGRVRELWAEHQDRLVTMLAEEFPDAMATEIRLGLTPSARPRRTHPGGSDATETH
jgi:hypothetical protein